MHETGRNMDGQPEPRKSASSFKPAGYIIGKGNFFFRDAQNHLTRLYHDITAVLNTNAFGYILEMRIIFYMIDF